MKRLLFIFVALCLFVWSGFRLLEDKSLAKVERIQGIYIFSDSRPVADYDVVGTMKIGLMGNPQYEKLRNEFIREMKWKYKEADGLILHLNNGGADTAEAIKLKDE